MIGKRFFAKNQQLIQEGLLLGLLFTLGACHQTHSQELVEEEESPLVEEHLESWFVDKTQPLGISFDHQDGRSGARYYVETAASGGGFIDFDNDGDLDIYLLNGAQTPGSAQGKAPTNKFFENQGNVFVDITEQAGLADAGYAMGMCVGDIDGDGWLDIFVTNYGQDTLFRNRGDGSFEDWTLEAGVGGELWGTGCAFADVDGDQDLDLYVANYVNFEFKNNPICKDEVHGVAFYCRPSVFNGQRDFLYINQGNGRFTEEAGLRGIDQSNQGKGFGAMFSDVDLDGDQDLFVANDGTMNRFYLNQGDGVFQDQSLLSGLGFNASGAAESGMGLDLGDANGDGLLDLVVTNYSFETNTLYLNRGQGLWEDATVNSGLVGPTYQPVGWGVRFFDVDNDKDQDLAIANGHVMDNISLFEPHISYAQANLLLLNNGDGSYEDASGKAGKVFGQPHVTRGLAVGDVNQDGRLDLLFTNTNGKPRLLINTMPKTGAWLRVNLRASNKNPFAIGALAKLFDKQKNLIGMAQVRSGGSFLSMSELTLHFGLGEAQKFYDLLIIWPDSEEQLLTDITPNQLLRVNQQQ